MKKIMNNIEVWNGDCMEIAKQYPEDWFDLAVVDPPYGLGFSARSKQKDHVVQRNGKISKVELGGFTTKDWDNHTPDASYFKLIKKISKRQIIWGCNYYDYPLPGGRLIWDKLNGSSDQYDCEVAYLSFTKRTDIVYYMWSGMIQGLLASNDVRKAYKQQGNKRLNEKRIHPTQKPVKLYDWIYKKYLPEGGRIIDTHAGSFSSAMPAMYRSEIEYTGIEIDKEYFEKGIDRMNRKLKDFVNQILYQ